MQTRESWRILPLLGGAALALAAQSAHAEAPLDLPVSWVDDRGDRESLVPLKSGYSVLGMFYTGCRRVCPQTVLVMKDLQTALRDRGVEPEMVLVSYAAEAESPRSLASFRLTHHLDSHWHLLAGDSDHTREFAARMGLGDYHSMDEHYFHEYRILLRDPQGNEHAVDWQHRDAAAAVAALLWSR
jgi:cytochrome oxidase Cu insertion factor (SCO1/SenC/PrrC family)